MVSSGASIPIGVLIGYDAEIISENSNQTVTIIGGDRKVDVLNNVRNTNRYKENVCLIRMVGHEWAQSTLQLIDELAFNGVDVFHGPTVDHGPLSFFISPYLESSHHLFVTPVKQ